mgnify:FL=1
MFLILASLPFSTWSRLSMIVSWVRADGSAAACFNLFYVSTGSWLFEHFVDFLLSILTFSLDASEALKEHRRTYTASAAPARAILDSENNLCPFPFPTAGPAPRLLLDAFKHRNLGLDVQLLTDAMEDSATAAARTALCALIFA